MKILSFLLILFATLTMATLSQAGTCTNSAIPASNPDTVYVDHGDGTVTDSRTGLMWKKCSEGQTYSGGTCTGSATTHTWAQALALAEAGSFDGHSDWRLPNFKELGSLVEECRVAPAINDALFPATPSLNFWSGSAGAYYSYYVWFVSFDDGYAGVNGLRSNYYSIRLVRGGQSFAAFLGQPAGAAVTFLSENLPDGSFQLGAATKRWRFKNGVVPLTSLQAVRVSADAGLGITAGSINLGTIAANSEFVVEVPLNAGRSSQALPKSVWKLVDGSGQDVAFSNSANNTFWVALRTNRPPRFSPLQLESLGGKSGQALSLPLIAQDDDGDALTFSVVEGGGSISGSTWNGSFTTGSGVEIRHLVIQVSDGLESTQQTIQVVVYGTSGLNGFFADVPVDNSPNSAYAAVHFLASKGIVIGYELVGSTTQRLFKPEDVISQAEALKMLLLAARERGLITLTQAPDVPGNLVVADVATGTYMNYSWAATYAYTAQKLGMIGNIADWNPAASLTQVELARWLNILLNLNVPLGLLEDSELLSRYLFTDATDFGSVSDYRSARQAAFFGYLGTLNTAFGPATQMQRGDFAVVAAKILRVPSIDGLVFGGTTTGTRFDQQLPVITHGQTLTINGVQNLVTHEILMNSGYVLEEWIDPPQNYVRLGVTLSDGRALGAARYVSELASSSLSLDTGTLDIRINTLLYLTVLFQSTAPAGADMERSGVGAVYYIPFAVDFPDNDGDGVRNDLDRWPDDWRFSSDTNNNGYPDQVDEYLTAIGLNATQTVVLHGVPQSYTYGDAVMNGYALGVGALSVTIVPQAAIDAGVMWSADGGASWHASSSIVAHPDGEYTITFKEVSGWSLPSVHNVVIQDSLAKVLYGNSELSGDLNGDNVVNLTDTIIALRIVNGEDVSLLTHWYDVDGDGKVGLAEAVSCLQKVGGVQRIH